MVREFADIAGFSPKQREAWLALWTRRTARVLYGGAGFGGKSYFDRCAGVGMCLKLADHYGVNRPRVVLARQTYDDLRDNHQAQLEEQWGHLGRVYRQHKDYGYAFVFHAKHRGAILLRNAQEKGLARGRGKEIHGGIFDESTQFTEEDFGNLLYNCRADSPFNPVLVSSNPDGIGFAYHRARWRPHLPASARLLPYPRGGSIENGDPLDYIFVQALPHDNPQWAKKRKVFLASIAGLPAHIRNARLFGKWDAPEGARWPLATEERMAWSGPISPSWRKVIGVDYGIAVPFSAHWLALHPDGFWIAYRELYSKGWTARAQARRIMQASPSNETYAWIKGDPAMWQAQQRHEDDDRRPVAQIYSEEFARETGFKGKFMAGIGGNRSERFATMDDLVGGFDLDEALLRVDVNACPNLWTELSSAVHPKKVHGLDGDIDSDCADHAITGVLYALHGSIKRKRKLDDITAAQWDPSRENKAEFYHRTGIWPV